MGVFSGSMWTYDSHRKEYYLHQFTKEQPDLNYRNPKVQQEMDVSIIAPILLSMKTSIAFIIIMLILVF